MKKTLYLSKHWDITTTSNIFEILMPDGKLIFIEWNNKHKIIDKNIWKL